MHLENIKNIIQDNYQTANVFKRNLIKEYLQILVLNFIYSRDDYKKLVFYGGSCLKHCFGLNRLSEDLDFVDLDKSIDLRRLARDLQIFLEKQIEVKLNLKVQRFRIYLKFPLWREFGLADKGESDFLFLKVEVFKQFDFCSKFDTQIMPVFVNNQSILIRSFDLPTLMSTKIRAVLHRKWEKTDKQGRSLIKAKGRDYYDLMWYLQKGIKPNLNCLPEVDSIDELREKLLEALNKLDKQSIKLDLEPLISDKVLINDLSGSIKKILKQQIEQF